MALLDLLSGGGGKKADFGKVKAHLLNPSLSSYFMVTIPDGPSDDGGWKKFKGSNGIASSKEKLQLLCSEATLPGSSLVTHEIRNDRTGVTERHAYRRMFDDRIDFTFMVNAGKDAYLPIKFFEGWIKYIAGESVASGDGKVGIKDENYAYRMKYPADYRAQQGLKVVKFEKSPSWGGGLSYNFIGAYPIAVTSMPVSYDTTQVLKSTVSFTYLRYYIDGIDETSEKDQKSGDKKNEDLSKPETTPPESGWTSPPDGKSITGQDLSNFNTKTNVEGAFNPSTKDAAPIPWHDESLLK